MAKTPPSKKKHILLRILIFLIVFYLCMIIIVKVYPTVDNTVQIGFGGVLLALGLPTLAAIFVPSLFRRIKQKNAPLDVQLPSQNKFADAKKYSTHFQPAPVVEPVIGPTVFEDDIDQAAHVIFDLGFVSVSGIQRRLKWSYSRAARAIDELEALGAVGPFNGSAPRALLMTREGYLTKRRKKPSTDPTSPEKVDVDKIISDEEEWRRQQYSDPVQYELDRIDGMDGSTFEHWCADLLRNNEYRDVSVTQASNDQGVDIIATKDGVMYAIQCKCYSSDLGNKPVQEVHTGRYIYHCHVGVVMTNRFFTDGAKEAAKATGVLLWDRNNLITMIKNASRV